MEDKEAIEILKGILEKHSLDEKETEAIRDAIGIMSWTKLVEGWKDRKMRIRDKRLRDE